MAESPSSDPSQSLSPSGSNPEGSQYWCYQCNKRVAIEADLPEVICNECKNGFVESIPAPPPPPPSDQINDDANFGNQFLQVLRLIAQAAREDDAPPPPPSEHADPADDDYLRIELDGWDNEDDEDEDNDEDDDDEVSVRVRNDDDDTNNNNNNNNNNNQNQSDDEDNEDEENREERDDAEERQRRREVLRLRLRDFAARAASRRNRIRDWAEILMGLENHSIELRFQVPDGSDTYIGNPGDYVDAAGYEALLQNLAESDTGGRRGAPPAAKSAIQGLESMEIEKEEDALLCAICKDMVNVGEVGKKLPCGHGYHGDCIVPWLGSRNSCPVCRFELPTDDLEYEEEKKKKKKAVVDCAVTDGGFGESSSSSGGAGRRGDYDPGFD